MGSIRYCSLRAEHSATDAAPGSPRVYKFVANDGEWDRYQDRLSVAGWQLDAFNANPVILFNHDDGSGGYFTAPTKALPIGKGRAYVEGSNLMVEIEFDSEDPFAQQVEKKVAKGILNAVSVRYLMQKYHDNERGGYDCDEQELLEISVVTIPGNPRALRAKAFDEDVIEAVAARVAARLAPAPISAKAESKSEFPVTDFAAALAAACGEVQ